jgi:predicted regulator of Ras-like GTPase activity (Roadblock/LC7/MglB family)
MINRHLKFYEPAADRIEKLISDLVVQSRARVAFLIDRIGQLIAAAGAVDEIDGTSLAALAAGNMATAGGMATALQEDGFRAQLHEGDKSRLQIQSVGRQGAILVVVFDDQTSLGLVRLRVNKAIDALGKILDELEQQQAAKAPKPTAGAAKLTDEEIDDIFEH